MQYLMHIYADFTYFFFRKNSNRVSASTTARKIKTHPQNIRGVRASCKINVPNKTPKTDSKLKNKDARDD